MANPQPDKFTRISNELLEAVLLTNFTKRQLNIILLVIRFSYGCGRKYALLRQSDFGIAGIYKGDVKRELEQLEAADVLHVDGEKISLNKDHDRWRISPVNTGSRERLKEVLKRNLEEKKVSKTLTEPEFKVSETLTPELVKHEPESSQNTNQAVSKTLTGYTPQANGDVGSRPPKETLKKLKEKLKKDPPLNPPQGGSGCSKNFAIPAEKQDNGAQLNAGKESDLPAEKLSCGAQEREGAKTAPGKKPAPTVGKAPGNDGEYDEYDQDFLKFWAEYPKKVEKCRAYRCWKTRIKEGTSGGELITAAKNYTADCRKWGTEERYIKHASTFLGPDKPYLDWVNRTEAKQEEEKKNSKKAMIRSLYLS